MGILDDNRVARAFPRKIEYVITIVDCESCKCCTSALIRTYDEATAPSRSLQIVSGSRSHVQRSPETVYFLNSTKF